VCFYIYFLPLEEGKFSQSEMMLESVRNTVGNFRLDSIFTVVNNAVQLLNVVSICRCYLLLICSEVRPVSYTSLAISFFK